MLPVRRLSGQPVQGVPLHSPNFLWKHTPYHPCHVLHKKSYKLPANLVDLPSMATQQRFINKYEKKLNEEPEREGLFPLHWDITFDKDVEDRMDVVETDHVGLIRHTTLNSDRALAFATNSKWPRTPKWDEKRGSGFTKYAHYQDVRKWKERQPFPREKRAKSCPNNLRTIQLASRYGQATEETRRWMLKEGFLARKQPNTW